MKRVISAVVVLIGLAAPASADTKACEDAYERKDYEAALKECRPLAEQGRAKAQYTLGIIYRWGLGVPQDYAEAAKWYRKAAERGHAAASFSLGEVYFFGNFSGKGVPEDKAEAVRWYRKAAEQGFDLAQFKLALMYDNGDSAPPPRSSARGSWPSQSSRGPPASFKIRSILRISGSRSSSLHALRRSASHVSPGRNSAGMNCNTTSDIPISGVNVSMMTPLVVAVRIRHSPYTSIGGSSSSQMTCCAVPSKLPRPWL